MLPRKCNPLVFVACLSHSILILCFNQSKQELDASHDCVIVARFCWHNCVFVCDVCASLVLSQDKEDKEDKEENDKAGFDDFGDYKSEKLGESMLSNKDEDF